MSDAPATETARPRLVLEHIRKSFGGVQALRDVTVEAHAGEVLALCGENGAGKSTLMKILAGAITAYEGQILIEGQPVRFLGPRDAEDSGVRIIYQELNLVPDLSVAANIFLGREPKNRLGLIDDPAMERQARQMFERLGAPIDPQARVGDLRIGDQQMVEIAKALMFAASIVIMDEPTSALSDAEVERLFRVIDDLRTAGVAVIYISHKMNEVFTLADRVTVLRDGQFVATATRAETGPEQVVRWMVGREIAALKFDAEPVRGAAVLNVEGLHLPAAPDSGRPSLQNVSFTLHQGEILGVAGLLGAGRTELLEALFGASANPPTGTITLEGRPVRFKGPGQAIAAGMALVTEDRKNLGLFAEMSVGQNITLVDLNRLASMGVLHPRSESGAIASSIERLGVKTDGPEALITSLSGGNQQKCIIARWLLGGPKVLLLDEPTRGIDVGAKAEIYLLMKRLAAQGMAIIMTSSELPEILAVSDRVLVLCEGRPTALIPRDQASEESIMQAATAFLDRAPARAS